MGTQLQIAKHGKVCTPAEADAPVFPGERRIRLRFIIVQAVAMRAFRNRWAAGATGNRLIQPLLGTSREWRVFLPKRRKLSRLVVLTTVRLPNCANVSKLPQASARTVAA
jgi:hypothetical protein